MKNQVYKVKGADKPIKVSYPRENLKEPVQKLSKDIKYYAFLEVERPEINPTTQCVKRKEVFLEEPHPLYPALLTCKLDWEILTYPQETIIERLNQSLGAYMDSEYLPETRIKHLGELMGLDGELTKERKAYLKALRKWETAQRKERDRRESAFINNNVFPSFNWEQKPQKLEL